jgi:hypothetical protein
MPSGRVWPRDISLRGGSGNKKTPQGLGGLRDEGLSSRYSIMSVLVGTSRVITRSR